MKLPTGENLIICGSRIDPRPCRCGKASTRLCDWKKGGGATCDAPLCEECTSSPAPDKDLCQTHAKMWQERQQRGKQT